MASIGILFGIIAMVSWGIVDFFIKKLTKQIGTYHTVLYRSFFSAIVLLIASLYFTRTIFTSRSSLLILIIIGFTGYLAYIFYVRGIEVGHVSIISPVAHSSAIITVLLSLVFFKESLNIIQIMALVLIIAGVVLVSFKYSEFKKEKHRFVKGFIWALAAVVGWGVTFFLWKIPLSDTSPFVVAFYIESLIFIFAFISSVPLKEKIISPLINKKIWLFVLSAGIITALGSLTYTIGINLEYVSLVAPIAAASPFIAVIMAYLFLKEKLELNQIIAVALIIIGLITIAL